MHAAAAASYHPCADVVAIIGFLDDLRDDSGRPVPHRRPARPRPSRSQVSVTAAPWLLSRLQDDAWHAIARRAARTWPSTTRPSSRSPASGTTPAGRDRSWPGKRERHDRRHARGPIRFERPHACRFQVGETDPCADHDGVGAMRRAVQRALGNHVPGQFWLEPGQGGQQQGPVISGQRGYPGRA